MVLSFIRSQQSEQGIFQDINQEDAQNYCGPGESEEYNQHYDDERYAQKRITQHLGGGVGFDIFPELEGKHRQLAHQQYAEDQGDPYQYPGNGCAERIRKIAQQVYEDDNLRMLFDASRGAAPEDIQMAAEMIRRLTERNKKK